MTLTEKIERKGYKVVVSIGWKDNGEKGTTGYFAVKPHQRTTQGKHAKTLRGLYDLVKSPRI